MTEPPPQYEYDVCFSFAYEDQKYVDAVAHKVKEMGLRLFYSPFVEAELWGENLHDYFSEIYSRKSRYCVMFISKHYADSIWTNLERIEAQARAFQESETYILPARFDRTEIPGLQKTVAYMSLVDKAPEDFAELIYRKVRTDDLPPLPIPPTPPHNPPIPPSSSVNKWIALGMGSVILALLIAWFGDLIKKPIDVTSSSPAPKKDERISPEPKPKPKPKPAYDESCKLDNPPIHCLWEENQ